MTRSAARRVNQPVGEAGEPAATVNVAVGAGGGDRAAAVKARRAERSKPQRASPRSASQVRRRCGPLASSAWREPAQLGREAPSPLRRDLAEPPRCAARAACVRSRQSTSQRLDLGTVVAPGGQIVLGQRCRRRTARRRPRRHRRPGRAAALASLASSPRARLEGGAVDHQAASWSVKPSTTPSCAAPASSGRASSPARRDGRRAARDDRVHQQLTSTSGIDGISPAAKPATARPRAARCRSAPARRTRKPAVTTPPGAGAAASSTVPVVRRRVKARRPSGAVPRATRTCPRPAC